MPLWHPEIWKQQLRDAAFYWLVLPGAVILSGLALDRVLVLPAIAGGTIFMAVALALLATGAWIITKATRDFEAIGHGTPNPFRPPKVLITSGAYRWCRHPMFLGYGLAALSVVLLFRSWAMLCISLPLLFAWQLRFLKREEEILSRRFQEDYDNYRHQVPLLLPWPRPKDVPHPKE